MYLRISVEVSDVDPNVTIRPAACQVVPEVSRSRSSSSTSQTEVSEVVGDRRADHPTADHDDAGTAGQVGVHHELQPRRAVTVPASAY